MDGVWGKSDSMGRREDHYREDCEEGRTQENGVEEVEVLDNIVTDRYVLVLSLIPHGPNAPLGVTADRREKSTEPPVAGRGLVEEGCVDGGGKGGSRRR